MDFLNQSFRIFTFSGIAVRVHILYVIWLALRLLDGGDVKLNLIWVSMFFVIVLLHEFGHCFGARAVGGDARNILMWPLGGLAFADAPMRPWPQFVTIAAGPLVNVGFCVASGALLMAATGSVAVVSLNPWDAVRFHEMDARWQVWVGFFYYINFILLCFNLLPIFPLDGGQLFRTILWPFVGLHRATVLAAQLGIAGAVALAALGVAREQWMLIAIAIFGGMTSWQHLRAARHGLVAEEYLSYDSAERFHRRRGLWERLRSGLLRGEPRAPRENPNPGGWEARQAERLRLEAEVDRILRKVHDEGIHSLSYVERQTLERATRQRRQRDAELEGERRV